MPTLTTLCKRLELPAFEEEYFNYCIDSWFNGQFDQCMKLFKDMSKQDRRRLLNYINGCYDYEHAVYKFYLKLI